MEDLKNIASAFAIEGEIKEIRPLGSGLINDTYKVTTCGESPDYVLQRINNSIFKDVALLQDNIEAVTSHIRNKLEKDHTADIDRKVLKFIEVKNADTASAQECSAKGDKETMNGNGTSEVQGKTWIEKDGKFWRLSVFIPDSYTYDTVNPEYSYAAGKAFGNFEAMLSDMEGTIGESIPDFHNMELRMKQLVEAVEADPVCRIDEPDEDRSAIEGDPDHREEVIAMLEDIDKYGIEMCKAEELYREGRLPKRICHCDTKVNNMLFDKDGNVLCVIDLDTVMPSFVFSDFGDFMRTAGNKAAEDEPDVTKVGLNMDIFRAFAKGYLESASDFLTDLEKENLPYAVCRFAFMQEVRFLADYINGDKYFKTKYIDHNFIRARSQMALFHSAMESRDEMARIIAGLSAGKENPKI